MPQGTGSVLPPAGKTLLTRLSQLQNSLSPKRLSEGLLDEDMSAYTTAAPGTGAACTASAPEVGAGYVAVAQAGMQIDAGTDDAFGDRPTLVSAPVADLLAPGVCHASTQVNPPASMSSTALVLTARQAA